MALSPEQLSTILAAITGNSQPFAKANMAQTAFQVQPATKDQPYIGMLDVRTPGMLGLENAGLFQLMSTLMDPYAFAQQGQAMTGATPTRDPANQGLAGLAGGQNPLWQMLFNTGVGQNPDPWTPPRGGGGLPGGGNPGPPRGSAGAPGLPSAPAPGGPSGEGNGAGQGEGIAPGPGAKPIPNDMIQTFNQLIRNQVPLNPNAKPTGQGGLSAGGEPLLTGVQSIVDAILAQTKAGTPAGALPGDTQRYTAQNIFQIPREIAQLVHGPNTLNATAADRDVDRYMFNAVNTGMYGPAGQLWSQLPADYQNNFVQDYVTTLGLGDNQRAAWGPFFESLGIKPKVDAKAAGGPLNPQNITLVGEQGPEAIVPTAQGQQVVPLGGGGMNPMMQMLQLMMGGARGMAQGGVLPEINPEITPINAIVNTNFTPGPINTDPSGSGQLTPGLAPNPGQFSPTQQPAGGAIGQTLAFNPELDAFNSLKTALGQGWGQQANTAFNAAGGLLGNTQGLMSQLQGMGSTDYLGGDLTRSLSSQLQGNPGQGVVNALQPVFQQNLQNAFGQLNASSPSIFNSAQQLQGADLSRQALNDFNLTASQALMQGLGQQQNAASILGQLLGTQRNSQMNALTSAGSLGQGAAQTMGGLGQAAGAGDISALQTLLGGAGQAGQGQFGRLMQAGQMALGQEQQAEQSRQFNQQYDLAAQQQQWQQFMGPTLQLLLAAMQMAEPTALQTVVGSQKA